VLAYIAFALKPLTRAERVESRKPAIMPFYGAKLQGFINFVLQQYVAQGVDELDTGKLVGLLELKYHSMSDAAAELGGVKAIREAFVGFQKHLSERNAGIG
jgi:type I restriction enzyme R subunit